MFDRPPSNRLELLICKAYQDPLAESVGRCELQGSVHDGLKDGVTDPCSTIESLLQSCNGQLIGHTYFESNGDRSSFLRYLQGTCLHVSRMNDKGKISMIVGAVGESSNLRDIKSMPEKNGNAYSVHISKILGEESVETKFLVPGCIPRGNVLLLTGEPGAKKSWIAYDLARAVSSGTGWLGKNNLVCPDGPLPVMILNYDNTTETLRTRLKKLGFTTDDQCWIHTLGFTKPYLPNAPSLLTLPSEQARLKYMLEYRKPALVIFDSIRQGVTLNEDDSKEMASLMTIFKSWLQINNTTVALIHHTPKDNKSSGWKSHARGSGEIIASSDVIIESNGAELNWTKTRTWEVGKTRKVEFDVVDEFKDSDADEVDEDSGLVEIELVQRVLVRAKTPLPFEVETRAINRVIDELKKEDNLVSFRELKKRFSEDKDIIKSDIVLQEALRNARMMGLIRFARNKFGRGYCVKQASV